MVTFESAARLTALKNKIDGVTAVESSTLSEAVDNALAGYGQGGASLDSVLVLVADFSDSGALTVLSGAYYGTKRAVVSL